MQMIWTDYIIFVVSGRISQMKTKLKWKHVRLTHNITVHNSMNKLEQNVLK